jgi:hypothetical protein
LPLQLNPKLLFDVAGQKLAPGSFLTVTASATDNCYTGAQTSHSRTVVFGIVVPEELFREILLRQQAERIKFRKASEEAEKIRDLIQSATDAKQLTEIARRHRALQLETLRITTVLNETFTEMKLNGLGTPEAHALMERNVLVPLKELADELIGPQTGAIEAVTPAPGAALETPKLAPLVDRQQKIIDRMKQILLQMAQWDSFVDVLNQLDHIIKLETGVKDDSQRLEKKEQQGLFDK